jgi:hypothetical protein
MRSWRAVSTRAKRLTHSCSGRALLSRKPLGTRSLCSVIGLGVLLLLAGCHHQSPSEPIDMSLTGRWSTTLTRGPCAGDWSMISLTLTQSGSTLAGELVTRDGVHFPVSGNLTGDSGEITVPVPVGTGECEPVLLQISRIGRDSGGHTVSFSGQIHGRCCGTLLESFMFTRPAGA